MISLDTVLEAFRLNLIIKQHAYDRMKERNLNIHAIEEAINSDEIIEQYPYDKPIPSVLILGRINGINPVHIVCAPTDIRLVVITAYHPSSDNWESNWKKRKKPEVQK